MMLILSLLQSQKEQQILDSKIVDTKTFQIKHVKFLDYLENFRIVRTVSGLSGQFLDCLDTYQIVQKIFSLSGHPMDYPDSFWIVQIISGLTK